MHMYRGRKYREDGEDAEFDSVCVGAVDPILWESILGMVSVGIWDKGTQGGRVVRRLKSIH